MTNKVRLQVARAYKKLLDKRVHRKVAIQMICKEYGVCRGTIYNYCNRFGLDIS